MDQGKYAHTFRLRLSCKEGASNEAYLLVVAKLRSRSHTTFGDAVVASFIRIAVAQALNPMLSIFEFAKVWNAEDTTALYSAQTLKGVLRRIVSGWIFSWRTC